MVRKYRLLTTSIVALSFVALCPPPAQAAQQSGDIAQDVTEPGADGSAASSVPADAPAAGSDIVVTARRRSEAITDVPISVSVLGGQDLASRGIERVDDLTRSVPAVSSRSTAGRRSNTQYEIRGITTTESLITQDPAVGVYVNEVYRARATGTNQSFYDIDNVQVLYGPQGTLFGRNSTGGAVLINTKKPVLGSFEGELSAGYGNLNRFELTGIVNVPLADTLALRLAGQRVSRDGYAVNITNGRRLADVDSWSGRASVLWTPTDSIENLTVGSVYHADELGSFNILLGFRPCPSASATAPGASCSGNPAQLGSATPTIRTALTNFAQNVAPFLAPYETANDASFRDFRGVADTASAAGTTTPDQFENTRNYSISNATTIEVGEGLTIKNIIGYNYTSLVTATDLDATPLKLLDTYLDTSNRQFTEELQLQGETGRLTWVIGGLYFWEKGRDIQITNSNVVTDTRQNLLGINKSYAIFAQGTYKLTDQLSLTAGGRYSWDKREAQYINPRTRNLLTGSNVCSLAAAIDPDGDCQFTDKVSFSNPSYTVSVDYKPTEDTLVYVAHRYGYRSGGLQSRVALTAFGPAGPFRPETVKDVELGFKGSFGLGGDARLRASLAVYKAWYNGLQRASTVPTFLPSPAPVSTTVIVNAGEATVKGLEAEMTLTPIRGFSLSGYFGYVDGNYTNYPAFIGTSTQLFDVPFVAAKYTAGATVAVTPIDDDDRGTLTWSTTVSYRSRYFAGDSLPFIDQETLVPAQFYVSSTLDWDSIGGSPISGQLWVRNAFNDRQVLGLVGLATTFGIVPGNVGEPRTYGITLKYRFGS